MIEENINIKERNCGWVCINKESLSDKYILKIFEKNPTDNIYIENKNKQIIGIITLGDFRRYYKLKLMNPIKQPQLQDIINTSYKRTDISENNFQILKQFKNINRLPVLDCQGKIVKEYYIEEHKQIDENIVQAIIFEISNMPCKFSKIYLVINSLLSNYNISGNSNYKVIDVAKETINYENIKDGNEIVLIDLDLIGFKYRELMYIENDINYYDLTDISIEKDEKQKYFSHVFVPDKEKNIYLENEIYENIEYFDSNKIIWDKKFKCFKYEGEIKKIPECIMLILNLGIYEIRIADQSVPLLTKALLLTKDNTKFYNNHKDPVIYRRPEHLCIESENDIIHNIFPQLQKIGVNIIIFGNVVDEFVDDFIFKNKKNFSRQEFAAYKSNEFDRDFPFVKNEGIRQIADKQGEYVNFINGERLTVGNPENYDNVIYLFGPCNIYGLFVADEDTIASKMRPHIDIKYYVKNMGNSWDVINLVMRKNEWKRGDIIIYFCYDSMNLKKHGFKVNSVLDAYRKTSDLDICIFDTLLHINKRLTENIAKEVVNVLKKELSYELLKNNYSEKYNFGIKNKKCFSDIPYDIKCWLKGVEKYKKDLKNNIGSIVMNCNPFTNGHLYLIKQAAAKVDFLYVFVVQEDKSFFSFNDRMKMVKEGTENISNVSVIPSGKYIISTDTMPGYFEKEMNPNLILDASNDILTFAKYIAPFFNIAVRFIGEEPLDKVTAQYNMAMKYILPQYGIKVDEIQRVTLDDGMIISASEVRKAIKNKDYGLLKKLLPESSYLYIKNNIKLI